MKNIHPGEILKMELVEGRNLTISKIAELLDMTRVNVSNVLNGHSAVTPNMALRLETVFGGNATFFLRLQSSYDLAKAKEVFDKNPPRIKRFEEA